jgi:plastocyanin
MLKPGTARVALAAALIAAAIGCAAGPGPAFAAAEEIVAGDAGGVNAFSQASYATDQGELVTLRNAGPAERHDVFSRLDGPDGARLFESDTIDPLETTTVPGTQYLTTGTYQFICNVHPLEMQASLVVGPAGTPVPRPAIKVSGKGGKVKKLAKKGKFQVRVSASSASSGVSLLAKLGKATVGSVAAFDLTAGQSRKLTVKLTKSGKKKLKKKKKASIKVTGSVPFGAPNTAKLSFK